MWLTWITSRTDSVVCSGTITYHWIGDMATLDAAITFKLLYRCKVCDYFNWRGTSCINCEINIMALDGTLERLLCLWLLELIDQEYSK